jgi:uncharacterized RDD family membrane protein YckC
MANNMLLDTTYEVETPEGVELQLRIAGPVVRAMAWILDFAIRLVLYVVLVYVFSTMGDFGIGLVLIVIFCLEWFYPVVFEIYFAGATPGKKVMAIKVLHDNARPISLQGSIIRNLLRPVDFLPIFYGVGLFSMLFNCQFKRLGDLAAATVVVYQEQIPKALNLPAATPLALPLALTVEEQHAIINFAQRSSSLSVERQQELANIVMALKHADYDIISSLHGLAQQLYGN